ncbi:MAG TPA: hypothetical protein VFW29_12465, partial [Solirubrobacteraceae bacterium]|nr:hypothetical protein [Solirubrobacteraceae bacterium]
MSREEPALERLAAALDELAERDAATLVAEAHIEARARVRGLLAEAIAERLLARAESELGALRGDRPPSAGGPPGANAPLRTPSALCGSPTPRAPASTATPAEPARKAEPGASGWYVYGIVEEGFQAPAVVGVDETQPLQVVCGAGLGALASRVPLNEFGEDA